MDNAYHHGFHRNMSDQNGARAGNIRQSQEFMRKWSIAQKINIIEILGWLIYFWLAERPFGRRSNHHWLSQRNLIGQWSIWRSHSRPQSQTVARMIKNRVIQAMIYLTSIAFPNGKSCETEMFASCDWQRMRLHKRTTLLLEKLGGLCPPNPRWAPDIPTPDRGVFIPETGTAGLGLLKASPSSPWSPPPDGDAVSLIIHPQWETSPL
jgi:hypothetical protein